VGDSIDIREASDRLLDFAEFFLRLGELQGQQVLTAIADRDPEFTYYVETVTAHPETLLELFRLYGQWVLEQLKANCGAGWDEAADACVRSERYRILRMQWEKTTLLWEEWEGLVGRGSGK
jgi:hypothetical protein